MYAKLKQTLAEMRAKLRVFFAHPQETPQQRQQRKTLQRRMRSVEALWEGSSEEPRDGRPEGPTRDQEPQGPPPSAHPTPVAVLTTSDSPGHLCLDFGTGYCKAAVCSPGGMPRPLKIGQAVGHGRGDPHMIPTALHISQRGEVIFGDAAIDTGAASDNVFDLIKDAIIDAERPSDLEELLPARINPTDRPVTKRQAITFFLAFFTQAALRCTRSRDVLRSIAIPVFPAQKADWVTATLSHDLANAHTMADHFGDRLFGSVPLQDSLGVLNKGSKLPDVMAEPPTVPEPVAAVAAQLLHWQPSDEGTPGAMLVVDVGAGTSDIAMFVKGEVHGMVTFRHVARSKRSIPKAGKAIDQAVVSHLVATSRRVGADRELVEARLQSERRGQPIKEELFTQGRVERLGIATSLGEFLNSELLRQVAGEIKQGFDDMLCEVDRSFVEHRRIPVRLSGGGATLPFLSDLAGQRYLGNPHTRQTPVQLVLASREPQWSDHDGFANLHREVRGKFHRLAVALGGAFYGAEARGWLRLEEDILWWGSKRGPTFKVP